MEFGVNDLSRYGSASYAHSRELTKHELLSAKEEIELSRRVQLSILVKKASHGREPDMHELKILSRGEKAKATLLTSNMRLVFHIAKYYRFRGLAYADLVGEGTCGLIKAIVKFDPNRGFRFSTYASHWVKQAVTRSVAEKSRLVRVPVNIHDMIITTNRAERNFRDKFGRKPMPAELARDVGLPITKVLLLLSCANVNSMDEPLGSTTDATAKDRIASDEVDPTQQGDRFLFLSVLRESMRSLSPREAHIVELRYGLGEGQRPMTLEQVGSLYHITRERVRQIEANALRKMRDPATAIRVRDVIATSNTAE